ncbi:MAG: sialate O-acetylesterase [Prevotellaceae bacterium]|nr:sialate O-acetylesterase [Prevotellaceae bacterium]
MRKTLLSLLLTGMALVADAKVGLPALIGDNMLLQQQTEVRLWGTAAPNVQVRVTPSWSGECVTCQADDEGNWLLQVATPAAGYTPYEITFDDGEPVTVQNVLIGEVWLASGQSNMEMPLKGFAGCPVKDSAQEIIHASEESGIRFFMVPKKQSYEPETNCDGAWQVPGIDTAPGFSATAWFFAKSLSHALQVPVGIVCSAYGGSRVESWMNREVLQQYPDVDLNPDSIAAKLDYTRPLLMYNAMLKPLENYTVKGIIWYQGCSNVGRHDTYARRMADMVRLWRAEWGLGELPFYFTEIAPYSYGGNGVAAAYLREAQCKAQSLIPGSAMISTNDLAEPYEIHNIHPRRKQEVGQRLSYLALNLTYGKKQFPCFGPQYKSWTVKGNEAWISFDHLEMGICRNDGLQGFEVAGEDRVFHAADKVWVNGQTGEVVVSSQEVPVPAAVRYCFRDFQPGTLIGAGELPAVPFRTDDWE